MRLFDFLSLMDPAVTPDQSKIHLATWNGEENPLGVFLGGTFDDWQRSQTRRNFERRFVVALISLPGTNRWMYAGVYESHDSVWDEVRQYNVYDLRVRAACSEFIGRLVVSFPRPGRQSYLNAESWADGILVGEIFPKRLTIGEFPGFKAVDLAKSELDIIVAQNLESWRTALSSVAGVYLISDTTTGKLYVGSATGEGGIWARWCQYAFSGHGGNVELVAILTAEGSARANDFRYSVLEIADTHANHSDIIGRETHWKKVLLTRDHGWNSN